MSDKKGFWIIGASVLFLTVATIAFIVCGALNLFELSVTGWLIALAVLFAMLFLCFCCWCIWDSFYNDWRRIKKNEHWKR